MRKDSTKTSKFQIFGIAIFDLTTFEDCKCENLICCHSVEKCFKKQVMVRTAAMKFKVVEFRHVQGSVFKKNLLDFVNKWMKHKR